MNQKMVALILALLILATGLSGCDKREDTRQYVNTIGVVITNDVDILFDELYVYAGDIHEMGEDHIKNSRLETKVGSFGVTVEAGGSYSVVVRDRDGTVYTFNGVPFSNGDLAVITYLEELMLIVYHRDDSVSEIIGQMVLPGDAPDQPQRELQKRVEFEFALENASGTAISRITMREAADPEKGEVELYIKPLQGGSEVTISARLYEEDVEITEWILCLYFEDGESVRLDEVFDPWTTQRMVISGGGGSFRLTVD
jgi:hypothetical protein